MNLRKSVNCAETFLQELFGVNLISNEEALIKVTLRIDETSKDLTDLLSEYIKHKSINPKRALDFEFGETYTCQEWLAKYLSDLNIFKTVDLIRAGEFDFNIIAKMSSSSPQLHNSIMFNGHTDVVPVTQEEYLNWIGGDPWSGHTDNGYVYGRGASDMKGGNSAVIWAIKSLVEIGFEPKGEVLATFIIGEESGEVEIGPKHILDSGASADIAIITEPTGLSICPAAVGWFFFHIEILGEAAHAAGRGRSIYPSEEGVVGVNAIDKMLKVILKLHDLERDWGLYKKHPLMEPGSMAINPVRISGGANQATTPDRCTAIFAVTLSPNALCKDAFKNIAEAVKSVCVGDSWLEKFPPILTYPYLQTFYDPVNLERGHPILPIFEAASKRVLGRTENIALMPTPTDANLFSSLKQSSLICGPGNLIGDGVHGINERIEISALISAAKIYAEAIIFWSSTEKSLA